MKEFLVSLYSNENFPMYLGIFIIILVIAFVVVFFLGKKDQKLSSTRELKAINNEDTKPIKTLEEKAYHSKKNTFIPEKDYPKDYPEKEYSESYKMDNVIDTLELDLPKIKEAYRPENVNFEFTKTIELPKLNKKNKKYETVAIEDIAHLEDSIDAELDHIKEYQDTISDVNFVDTMFEADEEFLDMPKLIDTSYTPLDNMPQSISEDFLKDTLYEEDEEILDMPKMKK